MPHYWFRVPLSGTAPHLKEAKQRGGAPAVKREIKKDAAMRGKEADVTFAADLSECRVNVFSAEPMSQEDIDWFRDRWDVRDEDPVDSTLSADESVLESDQWIWRGSSGSSETPAS